MRNMLFTDLLNSETGLKQYDLLRDALYRAGLPILEEDIEEIYREFLETGDIPVGMEEYLQ